MYEFRQRAGAGAASGSGASLTAGAGGSSDSSTAAVPTISTTVERHHHDAAGRSNQRHDVEEDEDEDDDACSTEPALVHPLLKRGPSGTTASSSLAALASFERASGHRVSSERVSSTSSSLNHFKTAHNSTDASELNVPAVGSGVAANQTLPLASTQPVSVNDLDADLRQLAILQTLLQRQQAIVQASVEAAAAAKRLKRELEQEENAKARRPGASRTAGTGTEVENSSSSLLGGFQPLSSSLHGVQHQQQQQPQGLGPSSDAPRVPSSSSTSWLDGLNTIHDPTPSSSRAAELAQAQQQLDLWTKVAFTSHVETPLPSSNNGGASPSRVPSIAPFQIHRSTTGAQEEDQDMEDERDGHLGPEFDWSSFYPDLMMDSDGRSHAPTMTTTSTTVIPFVVGGVVNPSSSIAAVLDGRGGPTTTSTPMSSTSTESKRPQAPPTTTKSVSRRASTSSRQRTRSPSPPLVDPSLIDKLLQDEYPLRPPLTEGTPEEIEQDKRRRNTEASARFRARKKQRDAVLLQTSAQLRAKAQALEKEKLGLVKENQWLRELAQAAGAGARVGVGGVRKRV